MVILAAESIAFAIKERYPGFPPIYVLTFIRLFDLLILLHWGPWLKQREHFLSALIESLKTTLTFVLIGLLFLILWKIMAGTSFLNINPRFFGHGHTLMIVFYVTSCLLSPVAEELVFRGLIYRNLRGRWNIWFSMAIVSCFFYLIHIATNGLKWIEGLVPFLGSLIFCTGYEKTKHILTPVLLHITGNVMIFSSPFIPLL